MKAVRIHSHGNSDVLSIDDISEPICGPQQVIIEMKAWALNHLDLWVRKGFGNKNALELPLILGSDGSGSDGSRMVGITVISRSIGSKIFAQWLIFILLL